MKGISGSTYLSFAFVTTSALAYFVPSFIAWKRIRRRFVWLFIVNLLIGWTVVGWMIVLIWASEMTCKETDK